MATTSPDTLRTPDPGDSYNLVADLAILGQDVQNALTLRANAYTGTVSQRTAFTSTATDGMLWQDTDGIKMIWRKDGAAWVPAVWRWSGTTAQMNGFTQAPNGFEWFNTADNSEYVRLGGAWVGTLTHTPTLGAGFAATGSGEAPVIVKSLDGFCTMSGRIYRGSGSLTNALTITDSKFRPARTVLTSITSMGGAGADGTRFHASLSTAGVFQLTPYTSSPAWTNLMWIPFNLSWYASPPS